MTGPTESLGKDRKGTEGREGKDRLVGKTGRYWGFPGIPQHCYLGKAWRWGGWIYNLVAR